MGGGAQQVPLSDKGGDARPVGLHGPFHEAGTSLRSVSRAIDQHLVYELQGESLEAEGLL